MTGIEPALSSSRKRRPAIGQHPDGLRTGFAGRSREHVSEGRARAPLVVACPGCQRAVARCLQAMAGPGGLEPPISRLEGGRSSSELQAQSPQAAPCPRVSSPRTARPRGAIASHSTRVKRAVIRKTHFLPGADTRGCREQDTPCSLRGRRSSPAVDTLLPLRHSNGTCMRDGPLSFVGAPAHTLFRAGFITLLRARLARPRCASGAQIREYSPLRFSLGRAIRAARDGF